MYLRIYVHSEDSDQLENVPTHSEDSDQCQNTYLRKYAHSGDSDQCQVRRQMGIMFRKVLSIFYKVMVC